MSQPLPRRSPAEHQKALIKALQTVARRQSMWEVFKDFVSMAALMHSNAADPEHFEAREAEYLQIVKRYERDEVNLIVEAYAHAVLALQGGMQDLLGSTYMQLELGNAGAGQFFTPMSLCRLMAAINLSDVEERIKERGFISINDPCVGGGAMLIAAAEVLSERGIDYRRHMVAVAQDIDLVAVRMAYVQFSILQIPAVVIHGNSLLVESRSVWRTQAYMLGNWGSRLRAVESTTPEPVADQREYEVPSAPAVLPEPQTSTPQLIVERSAQAELF